MYCLNRSLSPASPSQDSEGQTFRKGSEKALEVSLGTLEMWIHLPAISGKSLWHPTEALRLPVFVL